MVHTREEEINPKFSMENCDLTMSIVFKDVEAMEYCLLPLPAPYKVSRFQLLSLKCFCFHKNLTASSFHFHIPDCVVKGALNLNFLNLTISREKFLL